MLAAGIRSTGWWKWCGCLVLLLQASPGWAQFPLFQRAPYIAEKDQFVRAISNGANSQELINRLTELQYQTVRYDPVIQAGSAGGVPADSAVIRTDPNTPAGSRFAGVGSLEVVHPTLGTFICSSTVISDVHILSAAHCFDLDDDGAPDPGLNITLHLNDGATPSSNHTATASNVVIHPDYGGFSTAGANDDLAVVTMTAAFPASIPRYAYRTTPIASGEVLELVGYGQSGNGDVGYTVLPTFSDKRSGKNAADLLVADDEGTGAQEIFIYDFDGAAGSGILGGATLGNNVETNVGGGDSGGPAFVTDGGGNLVIAGVNTFEFSIPGSTNPPGFFGSLGGGIDVAPYATWIDGQIAPVPEPSTLLLSLPAALLVSAVRPRRRRM